MIVRFLHKKINYNKFQLESISTRIEDIRSRGYEESLGFVNLPFDYAMQMDCSELAQKKIQLQPKLLLLIGIGGSNLGTLAVYEMLYGRYCNDNNPVMQFYCADTLDPYKSEYFKSKVIETLASGSEMIIVVVTKSGTTMETMANSALFIDILKKYRPDSYKKYIVAITEKDSPLWSWGEEHNIDMLAIPKYIGGRYSVLSPVGLFPLALLGVSIESLCHGAQEALKNNDSFLSAAFLFEHYRAGMMIHDTFLFDDAAESLGKWYRQLMAESLGKDGFGIMPTVSMGTVDLHSMVQLYLGGPRVRCTTFVSVEQEYAQAIPENGLSQSQGSSLVVVQKKIIQGVQNAYENDNQQFVSIILERNEQSIGYFLQFKMLEIICLATLMKVNPFDQPQVELYKEEMRKL